MFPGFRRVLFQPGAVLSQRGFPPRSPFFSADHKRPLLLIGSAALVPLLGPRGHVLSEVLRVICLVCFACFVFFSFSFFFLSAARGVYGGGRNVTCNGGLRAVRRRQPGIPLFEDAACQLFFCRSRPPGRGFRCADEGEPANSPCWNQG